MKRILSTVLMAAMLPACARFQPTTPAVSASNYTPTGVMQSVTMKDSDIHYDPSVLAIGAPRTQVEKAFGDPNASTTTDSGQTEDVFAFNPDGSKFVNPQVRPRNIALAFLTMGTSVAVRQARLGITERKLTLYHVLYDSNGNIQSVKAEAMSGAPDKGPAIATPAASASPAIE